MMDVTNTNSLKELQLKLMVQEDQLHVNNQQLQEQTRDLARLEEALRESEEKLKLANDRLETIHNIETSILAAKSSKAIAKTALEHLDTRVPCLSSSVSIFDLEHGYSLLLAGLRTSRVAGGRIPLTLSPFMDKLLNGHSVILNDLTSMAGDSEGLQSALKIGGRAIIIVPLAVQGDTIGSINLISDVVNAFSTDEEEIIKQISGSMAIAIQNAQLLETEKKARREADTLRRVASNINAGLDQEALLDIILTQLQFVLPYDTASILQYKDKKLFITAHQGMNPDEKMLRALDQIPPNIVYLIEKKLPLIISDTQKDPEWIMFPGVEKIRCWLGVPLIAKEIFIGLLMLDKWEPDFYTYKSAILALAFANHAAITIENARLYRETQQYGALMEQQVALRTRDLTALYDITATISQYSGLPTILEKVMAMISTTMNCLVVSIHTLDQSRMIFKLVCHIGLTPAMAEYSRELPVDDPRLHYLIETREPNLFSKVQSDPLFSGIDKNPTINNIVAAPILTKGKIVGILGIASVRPQPFSREDIALLTSITDQIGIALENDRLRKQTEQIAITEERERLARDLHDSVTQSLFGLTLFAATARELLHNEEYTQAELFLDEIATTANQTHKEMRLLLYELRPAALKKEGLMGAIRQRLETVENRSGIQSSLSGSIAVELPDEVESAFFQVANEALNNVIKHAKADQVSVTFSFQERKLQMEIRDNGMGFDMNFLDQKSGMGLTNMKQRLAAVGGTCNYHSSPEEGTVVIASIEIGE